MRIGSLFSGAGGLDMAVEEVFGGEVIWQAEVDKAASKVLAYRFPCAPNLGDITQIDWKTVEPPDVLCGGFPCQDVSAAGKRAGIKNGTRSGLWSVFADAIDQLRPPLVVIENVRGLLSAQAHRNMEPDEATVGDRSDGPVLRALGAVLGDLSDLGYDAQWTTVAASSVGAPHRRERVFILAHAESARRGVRDTSDIGQAYREVNALADNRRAAAVSSDGHVDLLPTPRASDPCGAESRSSEGFSPQLGEVVRELAQSDKVIGTENNGAMSVLTTDSGKNQTVVVSLDGDGVAVDVGSGESSHSFVVAPGLAGTKLDLLPTPRSSDCFGAGVHGDGGMDLRTTIRLLPTPKAGEGNGGGNYNSPGHQSTVSGTVREIEQWGKYAAAIHRWEQIAGPAPAPTEPNRNGNPRLNPAFSEWMMGWPAGWVTDPDIGISRNDQLKIIGNGVCPQQAIAALRYLLTVAEVAA